MYVKQLPVTITQVEQIQVIPWGVGGGELLKKETGSSLENLELQYDSIKKRYKKFSCIFFFLCKTFLYWCMLWVKILAFCPEHRKWDHIHQLLPPSKTTSILPACQSFIWEFPCETTWQKTSVDFSVFLNFTFPIWTEILSSVNEPLPLQT